MKKIAFNLTVVTLLTIMVLIGWQLHHSPPTAIQLGLESSPPLTQQQPLIQLWSNLDCHTDKIKIVYYGKLNNYNGDNLANQAAILGNHIAMLLPQASNYLDSFQLEDNCAGIQKKILITKKAQDNYLFISIQGKMPLWKGANFIHSLDAIFAQATKQPEKIFLFCGTPHRFRDLAADIKAPLSQVNVKQSTTVTAENYCSTSAYTNQLDNYVVCLDKKVNLQIAIGYNKTTGSQQIYLGSPLIFEEY